MNRRRTTAKTASLPDPAELTAAQRETLALARVWWQEGERALDYLAAKARQEALLVRLRPFFDALRAEREPPADLVAPILPLARTLTANRALNRTMLTDGFAAALRDLLFGEAELPARLSAFLANERVGMQTASHFLYLAFPDRYPLVSDTTRAVLAPTPKQRAALRMQVRKRYGLTEEEPGAETMALLGDFALYEAARAALGLSSFVEVNAVLWHAREMPRPSRRAKHRAGSVVRETGGVYQREDPPENPAPPTEADLLDFIESSIAAQGFVFPSLAVRNYYVALKTKPFVILTGLSGTGKTRLTRLFADALTGGTPDQYLLLPVRPDWTDSTALLGYHNLLADRYVSTPFLHLLTVAGQPENREERAFFTCLDEMNLARVEHYFAEVLSAMETPEGRLPLHEGRYATLPPNVFLTGSVNMDEATHPFSRKVLDRANTIEFTEVCLTESAASKRSAALLEIPPPERQRLFLSGRVATFDTARERLGALEGTYPARVLGVLAGLNAALQKRGMHFGYRVRDEVMRYVAAAFTVEGEGLLLPGDREANLSAALDLQIVQKALPRIGGTQEALGGLLAELEAWAVENDFGRAQAKLTRMRARASEDGIVSYYEL